MSSDNNAAKSGPSQRVLEIVMALMFLSFGVIIIYGALKSGITWNFDGPRAGFFPFIVGLLVCIGAAVVLLQILADKTDLGIFAEWDQITQVISVALPTLAYIILIYVIGIYISSALLIGYFMMVLSRFSILRTLIISIAMPIITYFVFEKWFLVALPQGLYGEQIVAPIAAPIAKFIGDFAEILRPLLNIFRFKF